MKFNLDSSWSLFLDRDGVINEKLQDDYVKNWDEFSFKAGTLEALAELRKIFGYIFVVTNQRGVGLGKMTEQDLIDIHNKMVNEIEAAFGKIDSVYYCTDIDNASYYRKPNIGMGLLAKQDFPQIEFSKSVMVGDSISDMEFGKRLGMKCVLINSNLGCLNELEYLRFNSLLEYKSSLKVDRFS